LSTFACFGPQSASIHGQHPQLDRSSLNGSPLAAAPSLRQLRVYAMVPDVYCWRLVKALAGFFVVQESVAGPLRRIRFHNVESASGF
jgi:hypothetical protein